MELTTTQSNRFQLNWHNLLHVTVGANVLILAYMVIARQDTLALALAVILLLGLGLQRFRNGVLGLLLLGLINSDIAVWTVSGAVNNFVNGEALAALLLPTYLGVVSLICVTAAAATWITRHHPTRGARAAQWVGQIGLALLLVVTVASLFVRPRTVTAAAPVDILVTAENMGFAQTELVAQNGTITVQITNHDLWWHTFTIDELDVDLNVPMEAERSISFTAPPGTYTFYCAIPGHETIMQGTLIVRE